MKILFVDTCGDTCGIALSDGERVVAETIFRNEKGLSARLVDSVDGLLSGAGLTLGDIGCFGATTGPGSFTGLRIGVSTVKGFAMATGKPVVGVSSLAVLAMNLPHAVHPVCAMFDARKKEVYAGVYDPARPGKAIVADSVAPVTEFLKLLDRRVVFVGAGAAAYADTIRRELGEEALFAPAWCSAVRPSAGCSLAYAALLAGGAVDAALLGPAYIRPSEAEIAANRVDALLC